MMKLAKLLLCTLVGFLGLALPAGAAMAPPPEGGLAENCYFSSSRSGGSVTTTGNQRWKDSGDDKIGTQCTALTNGCGAVCPTGWVGSSGSCAGDQDRSSEPSDTVSFICASEPYHHCGNTSTCTKCVPKDPCADMSGLGSSLSYDQDGLKTMSEFNYVPGAKSKTGAENSGVITQDQANEICTFDNETPIYYSKNKTYSVTWPGSSAENPVCYVGCAVSTTPTCEEGYELVSSTDLESTLQQKCGIDFNRVDYSNFISNQDYVKQAGDSYCYKCPAELPMTCEQALTDLSSTMNLEEEGYLVATKPMTVIDLPESCQTTAAPAFISIDIAPDAEGKYLTHLTNNYETLATTLGDNQVCAYICDLGIEEGTCPPEGKSLTGLVEEAALKLYNLILGVTGGADGSSAAAASEATDEITAEGQQ